ncbi:MAG: CRTAC1 family protein [Candidatus Binatia bacterium]|nr:CRTAC1 family protein [Candidatus Binatia bacterium]
MPRGRARSDVRRVNGLRALVALALLVGCEPPPDALQHEAAIPAKPETIEQALRRVEIESRTTSPYTGTVEVQTLRKNWERIGESLEPGMQVHQLRRLAYGELRLGEVEAAVEALEQAHSIAVAHPDRFDRGATARVLLDVATGYLRLGETRNCVAMHTSDSCILPIRPAGVHTDQRGSRRATEVLEELLEVEPRSLSARWLLNVAYMTLGEFPGGVPEAYRISPEVFSSGEPEFRRFRDVGGRAGVSQRNLGGGVSVADFDGDGFLDLVIASSDPSAPLRLLSGDGAGRFRDRSDAAGLADQLGGNAVIHADYDDDGDQDLYVLRGAWLGRFGQHPNSLLRNRGDASFEDVTIEAGLAGRDVPSHSAAWADFDGDGDLDLYVGNESWGNYTVPSQLFRNEGDGRFVDVADEAGVDNYRWAKSVVWADFDDDRDPDLFVSNLYGPNRLYRNEGDGTFTDVAAEAGVLAPHGSLAAWAWDYDQDGALDLFVSSYTSDHHEARGYAEDEPDLERLVPALLGLPHELESARLYRGDGELGFEDVTERVGLDRAPPAAGGNFGDLDDDGWLDLYLTTGYPGYEALLPNAMFRNRDGRSFVDVTTPGGFGHLQKAEGLVFADFDADGDEDVYLRTGGMFPGDSFGDALFENPGTEGSFVVIDPEGMRSNRDGIGARIRVDVVDEDGRSRSLHRVVSAGGGFGAGPIPVRIGLGNAAGIERVEVYWPVSDVRQSFADVALGSALRVVEDQAPATTD